MYINVFHISGEAKDNNMGHIKIGGTAFCYQAKCSGLVCWCCSQNHECFSVMEDCQHDCVYKI